MSRFFRLVVMLFSVMRVLELNVVLVLLWLMLIIVLVLMFVIDRNCLIVLFVLIVGMLFM